MTRPESMNGYPPTSHTKFTTRHEPYAYQTLASGFCTVHDSPNGSQLRTYLWIHGSSGCGKTVLSAAIVEEISRLRTMDPSIALAYFFFDGRDSQTKLQKHESLIRSLIVQLSTKCDDLPEPLKLLHKDCNRGMSQPSIVELQETLLHIVSLFRDTYIVIDSLDECTERRAVLTWIQEITAQRTDILHLLATSRTEEDIGKRLRSLDSSPTLMTPECVNADIEKYVRHVLETDDAFEPWNEDIRAKLRSALLTSADGMFRLVALQVTELQDCHSEYSLMEQITRLPNGLNEFYGRMLSKVGEKVKEDALKLLQWLAFSFRPLRLDELVEVTGIIPDSERGLRFERSRVRSSRSVLNVCSRLVTYTEADGIIKLAHMSVKDYLLGQTCLAYLLQLDVVEDIRNLLTGSTCPLAAYAAGNWVHHIQLGNIAWSDTQQRLIMALFYPLPTSQSPPFNAWAKYVDQWHYQGLGLPLYYASYYGLQMVVDLLLEKGVDINAQSGHYGNALQAASYQGHELVVKLLLEKGVDVNVQGGDYGNALQAASDRGYEVIVKLLLEKDADVNAQGGIFRDALQAASWMDHEVIVKLLLENGADVNAQGGIYGNALHSASWMGYEVIVTLLLENGANVNAQGGKYRNALQAASFKGHEVIVNLLLGKGADMNAHGGEYGNALQAASCQGHELIVRLLLKKGADVNAQGGTYGNALQAASCEGHELIVKLLLEKGANVNAQGGQYRNALQAASAKGCERIVKLLLEKGADVNAQGGEYENALQAASYEGHEVITELLLKNGADMNAQGGEYGNALQVASDRGQEVIVKLLLEKGADVNAQGGEYGNALQAASAEGSEVIVKLLLENGADVNAQGGYYGNALQAAAATGHEMIVNLLLVKGANVNIEGGEYGNALQAALSEEHDVIVKLLLEKGADVNA